MHEYSGQSAKNYGQPSDKYYTLFPALDRLIPKVSDHQFLLDFGCGTGDLYPLVNDKGYQYTGMDLSPDMLGQARRKHPQANFIEVNAANPPPDHFSRYHVVLANMLFPSIATHADFRAVFQSIYHLLIEGGVAVITIGHPCFDGYMTKHFFHRDDIDTDFQGYFQPGAEYSAHRTINSQNFTFHDHHWTFSDYLNIGINQGLKLIAIDECPPVGELPTELVTKFTTRGCPNYLALKWQK